VQQTLSISICPSEKKSTKAIIFLSLDGMERFYISESDPTLKKQFKYFYRGDRLAPPSIK
jgi:hypothetical protein